MEKDKMQIEEDEVDELAPITVADLRPPMYVIHNNVILLPEEELVSLDPFDRLEKVFSLCPYWYQGQLEGIIRPVLVPQLKPAEYLLKWARLVYENNPARDGKEEQMFRAKF